jgi:hypothetical protein
MSMAERFGVFAENLWFRVTKEPKHFGKVSRIPGQVGFKSGQEWINRWVDVVWFTANGECPPCQKGDVLTVSGRWVETERVYQGTKYENREILADKIEGGSCDSQPESTRQDMKTMDSEVPF